LTGGRWDGKRLKWTLTGAPSRPYYVPLCHALSVLYTADGPRVDIFHDEQNVYAQHVLRIHGEAKSHLEPVSRCARVGELVFSSKLERVPLQAADLAAYLTFCRVAYGKQSPRTTLGRALRAFARFGNCIVLYNKRGIERYLVGLPQSIRNGQTASQVRAARRREDGLRKQREQQQQPKKRGVV
jgi:hypothetical protein